LFIDFFFSNFSIKGIILKIYPTLEPWNHINLPFPLFLEKKQNFSLNLILSSLFFINLIKIINGENNIIKLTIIL
jgi:hypothetical protein